MPSLAAAESPLVLRLPTDIVRLPILLFAALLLAACVEPEVALPETAPAVSVTEAERGVYAVALSSMAGEPVGEPAFPMVLGSLTAVRLAEVEPGDPIPAAVARDLPTLSEQAWSDFARRNAEAAEIPAPPQIPAVVSLVAEDTIRSMFSTNPADGWRRFRARYPDAFGLAVVSRVGFSADSTGALVFASVSCGGECGYGHYVQLRRSDGGWEVVGTSGAWVS